MFESGAIDATGAIAGNDSDADPRRFEPHYERSHPTRPGADLRADPGRPDGRADDRPADGDAVSQGQPPAAARLRQGDGGQRRLACTARRVATRTSPATAIASAMSCTVPAAGPFTVDVELRYQSIGYRWAHNLDELRRARAEALRLLLHARCRPSLRSSSPRRRRDSTPRGGPEGASADSKDGPTRRSLTSGSSSTRARWCRTRTRRPRTPGSTRGSRLRAPMNRQNPYCASSEPSGARVRR